MSCITRKFSSILGLKKYNRTIKKFKKRRFKNPSKMFRLNKFRKSRKRRRTRSPRRKSRTRRK